MQAAYELHNGLRIPSVGFGTFKLADAREAVRTALRVGYRHFDCASLYGNQEHVGAALREAMDAGAVKRADLWVTSKLWVTDMHADDVMPALKKTLAELGLDYLDLFLIHWPEAAQKGHSMPCEREQFDHVPLAETWGAMERLVDAGLVRSIGVSNFGPRRLRELLALARVRPAVLQVEAHVLLQQRALLELCARERVHVTSYRTLGALDSGNRPRDFPNLLELPAVVEVAHHSGRTPSQALIAWALQCGMSVVPKTSNEARMRENLAAAVLGPLGDAEIEQLRALDRGWHITGSFFYCGRTAEQYWGEEVLF